MWTVMPTSYSMAYPGRPDCPTGDGSADMTSVPHLRIITPPASPAGLATEPARQTLRLKLKPKAPTATGYVDGAWWPRSLDLSAELPALLAVLAIRQGRVQRVSYNLDAWDDAPRRIPVDGNPVRLGGFRSQDPHTLDVIGLTGPRITLLVLPPGTAQAIAHQILMTAGRRDNFDSIDELLAPTTPVERDPVTVDRRDAEEERWELDGGRVPQHA